MTMSIKKYKDALVHAERRGHTELAKFYRQQIENLTRPEPVFVKNAKPKVVFVVDHKGWCGARLTQSMMKRLPMFNCSMVKLGDKEHLTFDADLYVYRNIFWALVVQSPKWVFNKTITLVESEGALNSPVKSCLNANGFPMTGGDLLPKVLGVIPLNKKIEAQARKYNPKHLYKPIPNGLETKEFHPAVDFPTEFTVGASGNFSSPWIDEWKGFSKYVVPACKLAGVKLSWAGYEGYCQGQPRSAQISLEKMSDWYRSLSCFVHMSKSEACSGVIFEAMATGLPVISTRTGWHFENCTDEILWIGRPKIECQDAGWILNPKQGSKEDIDYTVHNLANRLIYLKTHRDFCKMQGQRARKFTEQHDWSLKISDWKEVIEFYLQRAKEQNGR
jgi:glycosyltransferase involved in cell wall biosynthesis